MLLDAFQIINIQLNVIHSQKTANYWLALWSEGDRNAQFPWH